MTRNERFGMLSFANGALDIAKAVEKQDSGDSDFRGYLMAATDIFFHLDLLPPDRQFMTTAMVVEAVIQAMGGAD